MEYDQLRESYRPGHIRMLLIAESPPPAANVPSSRHFYRSEKIRKDDRLFVNTIKALYPEARNSTEAEIESAKEQWLRRFQSDGWYMIEALTDSQRHEVTKQERQKRISDTLPDLMHRLSSLCSKDTRIILVKSNVFEVAFQPLRDAGYNVLNTELLDYPGRYNQRAYREKLIQLLP